VRNPATVGFARHYSVTVHTCEPADPASKGGSESTVKLAKADLVPKDTNLREEYASFAELEAACALFCETVNARVHRVTRRAPIDMLVEERARLHPLPAAPHTVSFGVTRTVGVNTPMVTFEGGQYSVPHQLLGQIVWVRVHSRGEAEAVVVVHVGDTGPVALARHHRATPGSPAMHDAHFPPAPAGALARTPRAGNAAEAEFLALGEGAGGVADRARSSGHHQDGGQDGRGRHDREAGRGRRRGLGAGARRGPRPLRRGRSGLDPGPPRPRPAGTDAPRR